MQHLRWTKNGRIFSKADEGKPDIFVWNGRVGEQNIDMGDGSFQPYHWDEANQTLRHSDCECYFANGFQTIKRLGQTLVSRSRMFIQREVAGEWVDVPHGSPTRNIAQDYPEEGKCTAYLDFPDMQGYAQGARFQVGIEAGRSQRQIFGFRMRSPVAGHFRLEWVLDIPDKANIEWIEEPVDLDDPNSPMIRIGIVVGKFNIVWRKSEAPFRDVTIENDPQAGRILRIFFGPYDLTPMQWLAIYPDVWGPSAIAVDEDDGSERTDQPWVINALNYGKRTGTTMYHTGVSFPYDGVDIPSSATINSAYFSCYGGDWDQITGAVRVQNLKNARWSSINLPQNATFVVNREGVATTFAPDTWYFGSGQGQATDLATDIATLITNLGTLTSGDRINVCLWSQESTDYESTSFEDFSAAGTNHATLTINYTLAAGGPSIPVFMSDYRRRRV